MFIDESGLSQRPHRCRTWSPKGQTPVLQYSFNWKKLSAVAGITWWNFYLGPWAVFVVPKWWSFSAILNVTSRTSCW